MLGLISRGMTAIRWASVSALDSVVAIFTNREPYYFPLPAHDRVLVGRVVVPDFTADYPAIAVAQVALANGFLLRSNPLCVLVAGGKAFFCRQNSSNHLHTLALCLFHHYKYKYSCVPEHVNPFPEQID